MSKKETSSKQIFGVGYATVIMIFVVICLSVLALLSYNAAGMNETLAKNNQNYITSYYTAENRAVEKIAKLDGVAYEALQSFFFEEGFENGVEELDVICAKCMDGYNVSFSENINDRLTLTVDMVFYSDPSMHDGKRYSVVGYKTEGISRDEDDGPSLGLWDGSLPIG